MIVMSVGLDNLYGFQEFSLDFSYPKKIVRSPIVDEHLPGCPSFRYKRVNIIMGSTATGKTTLGKALLAIFNFIERKDASALTEAICDPAKPARFCLRFVTKEKVLSQVETTINARDGSRLYKAGDFLVSVKQTPIGMRDTYERCVGRLDDQVTQYGSYADVFDEIESFGWYSTFPHEGAAWTATSDEDPLLFERTLAVVLKSLDPAIESVPRSHDMQDSYVVTHAAHKTLIRHGKLIEEEGAKLSRGTESGIAIALLLTAIMGRRYGWYYCDETFNFVHSDVEIELLALVAEKLSPDEQLFFTTHNSDILDMNFPHHTYLFLKKEGEQISAVSADHYLKRNTDNLRLAVENDRFFSKADLSLLSGL